MRNIPKIIICGIVSLLFAGCVSVVKVEKGAETQPPRFTESAQAFGNNDYSKLEVALSPEMREQMTEEHFHAAFSNLEKFGKVAKISYLDTVRHGVTFSELWKIVLVKKNERDEQLITEKILRIVGGVADGKPLVIGLMLQ